MGILFTAISCPRNRASVQRHFPALVTALRYPRGALQSWIGHPALSSMSYHGHLGLSLYGANFEVQ